MSTNVYECVYFLIVAPDDDDRFVHNLSNKEVAVLRNLTLMPDQHPDLKKDAVNLLFENIVAAVKVLLKRMPLSMAGDELRNRF